MKRNHLLFILLIGLIVTLYWILNDDVIETRRREIRGPPANTSLTRAWNRGPRLKKVLIYAATGFFRTAINDEKFLRTCKLTTAQCHITSNPSEFPNVSAVVFHGPDFDRHDLRPPFSDTKRNPTIPYVWWSLESPSNGLFAAPQDFINWTMYYTRNADIWYPYGHVHRRKEKIQVDYESIWSEKTKEKEAVWIGSNCETKNNRNRLMDALKILGMNITIFGACGVPAPKNCVGLAKQSFDCVAEIVREYKFYMAIENSFCEDYVTEKFYSTAMNRNSIPIVARRSIYSNLQIPDSSFIAIDDFDDLNDFVNYIHLVGSNKTLFLEYFKWKEKYEVVPEMNDGTGWCALCRRLIQGHFPSQSYGNLIEWQFENKPCNNSYLDSYFRVDREGRIVIEGQKRNNSQEIS